MPPRGKSSRRKPGKPKPRQFSEPTAREVELLASQMRRFAKGHGQDLSVREAKRRIRSGINKSRPKKAKGK